MTDAAQATASDDADDVAAQIWPATIKLKFPVEWEDERITQLTLRRGKIGDIRGVPVDGVPSTENIILIASRLSGQPTQLIQRLDMDDSAEVVRLVLLFFARCLGAGSKK